MNPIKDRPAETLTLAGAVAYLVCRGAGVDDPGTLTALTLVIAALPAFVTLLVERVPLVRRLLGFTKRSR